MKSQTVAPTQKNIREFKQMLEAMMGLQAEQQRFCREIRIETSAMREILKAKGIITAENWNQYFETAERVVEEALRLAGKSSQEKVEEMLRNLKGQKQ
jgi:hypothetical protein